MGIDFPVPSGVGATYTDPTSGNTYVCTVVGPPAQWVGSGSSTSLDNTYLRKDASNDPVTGTLTVTPSTNVEGLVVTQPSGNSAAAMRITNEGTGNSLLVEDAASTDSTPFVVRNDGTTLIGSATAVGTSKLQVTGGVQTESMNGGPLAGFRNRIINGNFDFWQHSTSQTIGTTINTRYFTADRWFNFFDGTGATRTVSRQAFTIGQSDVPNNPKYFYQLAQTVAGTGATINLITQRIESVYTLAGKEITVSFWAKAASALTMTANVAQGFGNGGTPSANVVAFNSPSLNVTTTWQKFTVTGTVPSISGKTLGTGNDDNLTFQFLLPINTTFTINIAQVQLEEGPVATDFEQRPLGTELALCQRYYYASATTSSSGAAAGISLGSYGYRPKATSALGNQPRNFWFPVQMRANPTVTLSQFGWHPTSTVNTQDTLPNNVAPGSVTLSTWVDGLSFTNEYSNTAVINMYAWTLTASAEL